MDILGFKEKCIIRSIKRASSKLDKIASKTELKEEYGNPKGKRSKTTNEVKPVENKNNPHQSFL